MKRVQTMNENLMFPSSRCPTNEHTCMKIQSVTQAVLALLVYHSHSRMVKINAVDSYIISHSSCLIHLRSVSVVIPACGSATD